MTDTVTVKLLVWEGDEFYIDAGTGMGIAYRVTSYAGMNEPFKVECRGSYWKREGEMFSDIEAAKAAAQSDYERRILSALEPQTPAQAALSLRNIEPDDGFWRSCSGCHETVDGQETGWYPYSPVFKCYLGAGCRECGGLGAVWDDTDYEDMASAIAGGE